MSTITHEIIGKAVLETLERRQMLAGVSFHDGVLSVQGQSAVTNDLAVHASLDGSTIWGVANGQSGTPIQTSIVRQIRIIGGDNNDTISLDAGVKIPVYVQGGNGDDSITTADGNDTIRGGNGRDTLDGSCGNDVIDGGNDDDSIHGGAGRDSIDGGRGHDWVDGDNGNDDIDAARGHDSITGGGGNDVITTDTGSTYAVGSYGNDTISGESNDTLIGGPGRDVIVGGLTATPPPTGPVEIPGPGDGPIEQNPPVNDFPVIRNFSIIDTNTGSTISGFDAIKGSADVDLTALASSQLGIRANLPPDFRGSVAFSIDGGADIVKGALTNFTLSAADWDWSVGAHTITSRVIADGASGPAQSLALNVIREVPPPLNPGGDNFDAPIPLILTQSTTVAAGHAIHVNGVDSTLKVGTPLTAKYEWDFGDAGSKYNQLRGFNAAHAYDTPGNYTVTLTVTDEKGAQAVATQQITITDAGRKIIYVSSSSGSDSNSGLSPQQAIRTLDKAEALVADNTEILLNRGDAFSVSDTLRIKANNVVMGAYGSAADRPRLNWTGGAGFTPMIATDPASRDVTIEGLSFDKAPKHDGIHVGGKDITIRGCEFLTIGTAINSNSKPTGVLAQDNTVPLADGMSGYFAWVEGTDHVYLGNYVANSTREHGIRDGWADRILVAYNDLANIDRRQQGDSLDSAIQTLTLHLGNYMYVYNNSFNNGRVEIGPLGGRDGLMKSDWQVQRLNWAVVEDNTFDGGAFLDIDHGTNHMMVRGNVFNQTAGSDITVGGYSTVYQRDVEDLTITRNTAINTGTSGNFLWLGGKAVGITLTENLFVAPNITPGVGQAGGMFVADTDLSSFRLIDGNIWPTANPTKWAQGGVNFVGAAMSAACYCDPGEWNDLPQVGDDSFSNVPTDIPTYSLSVNGRVAGSALPMGTRIAA